MKTRKTTMKKFALALAAASAFGVVAHADTVTVKDADGNGTYSMDELVAAYPAVTADIFKAIDTNADGAVSPDELAAAVAAGTVK